jgi:ribonuclease HII
VDDKEAVILEIERSLWRKGHSFIAGVDEAGRGPLAGPVVAAAVILPEKISPFITKDSKKLSKKKREELFYQILSKAVSVGVGFADVEEIDELNIYRATLLAAKRAISELSPAPDFLITDYIKIPEFADRILPLVKGDEKSISCACASVVAKVVRDYIMDSLCPLFPEYGFSSHKGYPTKRHFEALKKYGITALHRRSFAGLSSLGERGRGAGMLLSKEERLRYYREKLEELFGRD